MAEKQKRVPKSISLPAELAKRLDEEAETRLIAPSLIVEKAIEVFLGNLPPVDLELRSGGEDDD